jgi:hypothetical protein
MKKKNIRSYPKRLRLKTLRTLNKSKLIIKSVCKSLKNVKKDKIRGEKI